MENKELLICKCYSPEHQVLFRWFDDDEEVYMEVLLNPEYKWWKRVWIAIKYIFGYKCKYGMFDEVILNKEDVPKLEKIVEYLKKSR